MVLAANTPLTIIRGEQSEAPVAAAKIIYEGAPLGRNSSGYAEGLVAGDAFWGHAMEYVDNSLGLDGVLTVKRLRGRYRLEVTITSIAITDVGKEVFASADDTYTLTSGTNTKVGVVERYVTDNTCIVEFQTCEALEAGFNLGTVVVSTTGLSIMSFTSQFKAATGYHVGIWGNSQLAADGNGSVYTLRGHAEVASGITLSGDSVYLVGVQGRIKNSGVIDSTGLLAAGVLGQLLDGGTYTALSRIASIWADSQLAKTISSGLSALFLGSNNGATVLDYCMYFDPGDKVTNFLGFESSLNMISNGGTGNTTLKTGNDWKKVKCTINGSIYYMILMNNPTES